MPRPNGNALPHDPRPSPGTLTSQYRQPTPWHAWVGPNRHATGASLHTAKTGNEAHHCGDSRLRTFTIHLARRTCPGTAAIRKRPRALGGTPGVEKMGEPAAESLLPPAPDPLHRQVSL